MSKQHELSTVINTGIVAVIRSQRSEPLIDVARALLAGGVKAMEITFTVPRAIGVLEKVADELGDQVLLGAGTVLDAETARAALLAGAQFIVSPSLNLDVIRLCRRYDKLVMPGAFTPTEIVTAWEAGADIVKVFPADTMGPKYLKALAAPLPQIQLMPTGGVDLHNAAEFIQSGACALGVGGSLVKKSAIENGDMRQIEMLAQQFVAAVESARGSA